MNSIYFCDTSNHFNNQAVNLLYRKSEHRYIICWKTGHITVNNNKAYINFENHQNQELQEYNLTFTQQLWMIEQTKTEYRYAFVLL